MSKKCLIILSYVDHPSDRLLYQLTEDADYIICADGGQMIARNFNIIPDAVIGDFDSTTIDQRFDCLYITYPSEKDLTDAEASLNHAIEMNCNNITFYGGIGGRLDHMLGNISILSKFTERGITVRFMDDSNYLTMITNGSINLPNSRRYKYFGVVPYDSEAKGVTITGAKYELHNVDMKRTGTLGISNEITGSYARVTVKKGTLLIARSRDTEPQK